MSVAWRQITASTGIKMSACLSLILGAIAIDFSGGTTGARGPRESWAPTTVAPLLIAQVPATVPVRASMPTDLSVGEIPTGARIIRLDWTAGSWRESNLTPKFAAAAEPSLSFDGASFLFVGRQLAQDGAAVFEMTVDGRHARLVHRPDDGCDQPIYLSTLYQLDAPAPVEQIAFRSRGRGGERSAMFRCDRSGGEPRQITFAPGGVSDPLLLGDGRLLFSMAPDAPEDPVDDTAFSVGLATIHTDGADVFPFAVPRRNEILHALCETTGGRIVISARGSDSTSQLMFASRSSPWLMEPLSGEKGSAGECLSVSPGPDDRVLLAAMRRRAGETFGIRKMQAGDGRDLGVLFDDPDWHEVRVVVVAPRVRPPGRSTVVSESVASGQLYCLNAYASEDEPAGRPRTPKIVAVRLYAWRGDQVIADMEAGASRSPHWRRSPAARPRRGEVVLGEAGVEADGSFFLELPSATPFRLETLDASGEALRTMSSYSWVMPMERRGCVGCHEDRRLAPPNRHVLALRRPPHQLGPPRDRHMRSIEQHDDRDVP